MFDFLFSFITIVFTIIPNFFFTFFTCVLFLEEGRGGARSSVPLHSLFIYSVFVLAL